MTLDEYKTIILHRLGAPLLDIEVEMDGIPEPTDGDEPTPTDNKYNFMGDLINAAFIEIKDYVDTIEYLTVPMPQNAVIDLSQYNVRAISYVMRGTANMMTTPENIDSLLYTPLTTFQTQSQMMGFSPYTQRSFVMDYAASMIYRQMRNNLGQDLDYTYDVKNKKLYLYQQIPGAAQITVAYYPEYTSIEQITDPWWVNLLMRLAIGYVKETVGRIRSKYEPNSAPYTLDGAQLVDEGLAEQEAVRQILMDNNDTLIPID